MITVLFVLLALLVLCAPFLMTARNADEASRHVGERVQLRLSHDAAERHARGILAASHPSVDETRDFDSLDELTVPTDFAPEFLNAQDAEGVMWDVEVSDESGLIDLGSAGPQVIANALGLVALATKVISKDAQEIPVTTTQGFPDKGLLSIAGELVLYAAIDGNTFVGCQRGIGVRYDDEGAAVPEGPRPPSNHGLGTPVYDQRVEALAIWRMAGSEAELRVFDAPEQLKEANEFVLYEDEEHPAGFSNSDWLRLRQVASVHARWKGGRRWQHATRLTLPVEAGVTQAIEVGESRWFNEGATLRITDGVSTELRTVQRRYQGSIVLDRVLGQNYDAFQAEVAVLAKRPVNLNTAPDSVLPLLFENLQLRGRNSRISRGEAAQLAAEVLRRRPFTGHEDFIRRLVLPAAGLKEVPEGEEALEAFLTEQDALALYANGLNANDALLAFSTMPFSYVSREVYDLELRATVNAKSGVQRASAVRERTDLVAPGRPLFHMWSRQADLDEALRLSREAPWWTTGPNPTTRYDGSTVPPSRLSPHFGSVEGFGIVSALLDPGSTDMNLPGLKFDQVFASTEDDGFGQLWAARVDEQTPGRSGRVLHFDHETRDLEGRYLPDQTESFSTDDDRLGWTEGDDPLLKPISFEAWIRPTAQTGGSLLDIGGGSNERDRLQLLIEEGELVLRVLDGFGDHSGTPQVEIGELTFPVAGADSPGLPTDVWSHVMVDVRGNQPSQMTMLVNGLAHGVQRPGMSRLAAGVAQGSEFLPLESTLGFPPQGVARVGNELVEYVLIDGGLSCLHNDTGPLAGFGGRQARTRWNLDGNPSELADLQTSHPAGTPVEHYGYSLPLKSNLPSGGAALPNELGMWRVARVVGLEGELGDGIGLGGVTMGVGIEGEARRQAPFDLILSSGDAPASEDTTFMSAFQPEGGYAVLSQHLIRVNDQILTAFNTPYAGLEVVKYSGYTNNTLHVIERGSNVRRELRMLSGVQDELLGGDAGRAFVFQWQVIFLGIGDPNVLMSMACYAMPISLSAPGAGAFSGFLDPIAQDGNWSEFAQITRLEEAEFTEWVRYDEVVNGQLVRSDPGALREAYFALADERIDENIDIDDDGQAGGASLQPPPPAPPPAPSSSAPRAAAGPAWDPLRGEAQDGDNLPLTRAVREALRFRGVMGTFSHAHPTGTPVLPVFRCRDPVSPQAPESGLASGLPGAQDAVFVVGSEPDHLGWPLVVHRAHRPWPLTSRHDWVQDASDQVAVAVSGTFSADEDRLLWTDVYVALESECPEPMASSIFEGNEATLSESRLLTRLVKFPSGERPRAVAGVGIGAGYREDSDAVVPSVVIDEVVFGDPRFARGAVGALPANSTQGSQLILAENFAAGASSFLAWPNSVRNSNGAYTSNDAFLEQMPEDGGLLQIGEEILSYTSRDPIGGVVTVLDGGRGLLGTIEQPHQRGESITWLEHIPVTTLAVAISASDGTLPVVDTEGFPREGLVLVGSELMHYTRIRAGALEMPRASSEAGAKDEKGFGLFRGRFGTPATGHAAGEAVILFPFRYWDRYAPRADAPELGYLGFELDEPGAWFDSYFWDWQPAVAAGSRVGVLVRTDESTPWDANPDQADGLWVSWDGRPEGLEIPIGVQSDRVEWRAFVQYELGAFDLTNGLSHGWKATPRLRRLGVSYLAPGRVLRSVER